MASATVKLLLSGSLVYTLLFLSPVAEWVKNKRELETPLNSWRKLSECVSLQRLERDPYDGNHCHQPPLVVWLAYFLQQAPIEASQALFVVVNTATATALLFAARLAFTDLVKEQSRGLSRYAKGVQGILIDGAQKESVSLMVAAMYLFNPYTIGTCLSLSLNTLYDFTVAFSLLCALRGSWMMSTVGLAVATYCSLYPAILLLPFGIIAITKMNGSTSYDALPKSYGADMVLVFTVFVSSLALLAGVSYAIMGSWLYIPGTYGIILSVSDLSPNMGLFWYFFQEMFEHFRTFFLVVFHLIVLFFALPLTLLLRKHPVFLVYVMVSVITLFKSYASFGDLSLPMALLPLWMHSHKHMNNTFVVFVLFLFSSVLSPIFYHLWIYAGTGNANFFYATTLIYSTAQTLLLGDVVMAFLKYDYLLHNGLEPKTPDGKEGKLVFK